MVTVDADGDGPEGGQGAAGDLHGTDGQRRVRRRPRAWPPPTSPEPKGDVACTQISGGPETATIKGTLRGEPIDASFSRSDGCEIARWDKLKPLFDQVK